jgi:hypothetical protein
MTFTARMTVAQASIPSRFVTPGSGLPLTGLSTEACSVVPTRTRADSEPASADSDRCRYANNHDARPGARLGLASIWFGLVND